MLIAQKIENLMNGISEKPHDLRHPSQGVVQDNALDSSTKGKLKRPPTVHVGKVSSSPLGYGEAFVHTIHRDEKEAYRVVLANGAIQVFDARTGEEYPVTMNTLSGYLDGATDGYRALTIGDSTIIVNRSKKVGNLSAASDAPRFEALAHVRQADFSTGYTLTVNGHTVRHITVDGTHAAARQKIATDIIARALYTSLRHEEGLANKVGFKLIGSTIYMESLSGEDFTVEAADGLADKGLVVVKGRVQSFDDLPERAQDGFVVEITGHGGTAKDNYWVVYDGTNTPDGKGVWRETLKPETLTSLDPATMPHRLVAYGFMSSPRLAAGVPRDPQVVAGEYTVTGAGMDEDPNTATPVPEEDDDELSGHTTRRRRSSLPAADRTYVSYGVDTSVMVPNTGVFVVTRVDGVEKDRRFYESGRTWERETVDVGATPDLAAVEVAMEYATGASPAVSRQGTVNIPGTRRPIPPEEDGGDTGGGDTGGGGGGTERPGRREGPGITQDTLVSRRIVFSRRRLLGVTERDAVTSARLNSYPAGCVIKATVGVTVFQYTVGSTDESVSTVASGLQALIDADLNYTAALQGSNVIDIRKAGGGAAPSVSVEVVWDPTTQAWLPGADMAPGGLVGYEVINLTDSSSALISANTATTITTGAYAGGVDNKVLFLDKVGVKGSEGSPYFTFESIEWEPRTVGDLEGAAWPSFHHKRISDVFHYEGRLGFVHGESVVMSRSGDLFNFFRETLQDVLPGDYIDIDNAHPLTSDFHSVFQWNGKLYLFSEAGQYELSGEPAITPQTVRLDLVSKFPNTSRVRPCPAGSRLFMARSRKHATQVLDYMHPPQDRPTADDVTVNVPGYLRGPPAVMAGDGALGFLAVRCGAGNVLYIYVHEYGPEGERYQSSWSRWVLSPAAEVIHMDTIDGSLGLLVKYPDGVFLETIDLSSALNYEG